ncbi:dnaJ homolog subfamily C member 30, mitochondrial [Rhipicephalus microplus]|uniref:dnaJ homolog subfamily C member 30, mitochondrial n=1 Tax=Rhipicephalus microplus TaxID=6941 RepID=UPI003F6CA74B
MRAAACVLCRRCASSSAKRTYYDVLEVSPRAKQNEIKAAYYRLSMRYHPDKNKGSSSERFQEITTAYDTLSNESLRAHYDDKIMGSSPQQGLHARKPARRAPMSGRSPIYNFDEFYRQHYGDAVKSYQWRRKKFEDVMREEEMQIRQGKDAGVTLALFAVVALALFGVHVWEKMHDKPSSPPSQKGK